MAGNDSLLMFSILLLLGATLVWAGLVVVFFRRMRERDPELYRELGRPGLSVEGRSGATLELVGFLLRRKYAASADSGLRRLGDLMRVFFIGYLVALAAGFAVFIPDW